MARNMFGGSSDDYAVDTNGRPLPNRRIRFYTSAAMTTEITDLASDISGTGTPLAVSTDGHGFWGPAYGPDGVTTMYAGAADGAGNPPAYVVAIYTHSAAGVSSFNTRTGPVTLAKADVTGTGLAAADVAADASGAAATVQTNLTAEVTRATAAEAALGGGMQFRTAVVVATTNQALSGLPTVDSVTLTAGQVILLTGQTTGSQNGLWAVAAGAWARPANFPAGLNATGTSVLVESGTTGAGTTYAVTGTTNNVVGTNVLTFVKTSGSTASGLPQTIVSKTANYTALAGDFVEGDTTSAGFAVTLPANPAVGALVSVKKVSSDVNVLTITPSGGGTIDGDANATTTSQWSGATFEHKGSNVWRIAAAMQVTGPQGAAGPTGTPGAAATVTVGTTTTGAAGSNAAVTNSGSTSAAILNFTVPAGATGATGPIAQIQGNGTNAAVRPTLDFEGSTVTVTDDAGNSRTKVTIAGGGAGGLKPLFRSGAYTTLLPSVGVGSGGNNAVTAIGQIIVFPFYLDGATTFNSMAMHVWSTGVASATLRVGFYNDSSGLPGTLLADLGTMSAAAGGAVTATISQAVPAGRNWCAFVQQGGASIFQSYTSGVSGLVGDASASPLFAVTGSPAGLRSSASTFTTALPGTFPTLDTVTVDAASLLRIVFKAA